MSVSGRSGCGPPGPPSMWSRNVIAVLCEISSSVVPPIGSMLITLISVGFVSVSMYSPMVSCSIATRLTWLVARSRVVSRVPTPRANVSNAICSSRVCSRASLIGRWKSYGWMPPVPRRPRPRLTEMADGDWVTSSASAMVAPS